MDRPDASPAISVIVPCHGTLDHVAELTESLLAQDASFSWEVIFVDNNLTPAERKRLEGEIQPLPDVRIVEERAQGISPARNAGAAVARGAVLAFIDADDVAAATWLRGLADAVSPGRVAAGRLDVDKLNPPWLGRTRGIQPAGEEYLVEGVYPVAPGGNMAITKHDFDRLEGFGAGADALEDFEFCFRAWTNGLTVRQAGTDATIHYRLRQESRALYRQGYLYGRARARVYRTLVDHELVKRRSLSGWRSWAKLALTVPMAPFSRGQRAMAAWILGNRLGRVAGSIRYRVVYL
jgi:glycosyltransferase involved in cell wall biosynthesis